MKEQHFSDPHMSESYKKALQKSPTQLAVEAFINHEINATEYGKIIQEEIERRIKDIKSLIST